LSKHRAAPVCARCRREPPRCMSNPRGDRPRRRRSSAAPRRRQEWRPAPPLDCRNTRCWPMPRASHRPATQECLWIPATIRPRPLPRDRGAPRDPATTAVRRRSRGVLGSQQAALNGLEDADAAGTGFDG
jgi:hypothetical protein